MQLRPQKQIGDTVSELNNLAWHALNGNQSSFAERSEDGRATRFTRDVSMFWAVDQCSPDDWASLRDFAGGRAVVMVRSDVPSPPDVWDVLFSETLTQYVAETPGIVPDLETVTLGADDVDDMIALTTLTEPGPFVARTYELGHYVGVRDDTGRLVAMAGERLQTDQFSEISAVCVHPAARRTGLGAALTTFLVHEIHDRGKQAMLHVRHGNDPAHGLYRSIGFRAAGEVTVGAWRIPR